MKVGQIKQIAIIGAGIMGHGFAQVFAQKGFPVFLHDIDKEIVKRAFLRIEANLDTFIEHGMISQKEKKPPWKRLQPARIWEKPSVRQISSWRPSPRSWT
jgi:3-hydroxybutyryl-CoA dehydrogenase